MDAFFAPSMKKTNAGTPHDAFGDITNAQWKANVETPHDTFGGDVANAQRKAGSQTHSRRQMQGLLVMPLETSQTYRGRQMWGLLVTP